MLSSISLLNAKYYLNHNLKDLDHFDYHYRRNGVSEDTNCSRKCHTWFQFEENFPWDLLDMAFPYVQHSFGIDCLDPAHWLQLYNPDNFLSNYNN